MAAPAFIAKGTVDSDTTNSLTPTYMGSINANDLIFLAVFDVGIGTISVPSGFTLVKSTYYSDSPFNPSKRLSVYVKIATGSESGTITVSRSSHASNDIFMAQFYQYRGTSYCTVEDSQGQSGAVTTITWSAISVGGTERTLITFVGNYSGSNPGTPSGYTNSASDSFTTGSTSYLEANTFANVSSDGSVTGTNGSTNGWAAVHVGIYNYTPSGAGTRSFIVN